ncbi:MAG TPA: hypothetical protein VKH45_08325 [Candidatus Acidoferrum sp.]|nr:hypothetical protein [Candidatus Acidoferrum sp.]
MNRRRNLLALSAAVLLALSLVLILSAGLAANADAPWGFSLSNLDPSCKPCQDFYKFAMGGWMKANPIPAEYPSWGDFSFSSLIDTIHSPEALADPYGNKVTLTREFLSLPLLADVITDTHFVKRDRLGRLFVFMARILEDGWTKQVRAIAVEENAAVLIEPDGTAYVVGQGPAYFLLADKKPEVCAHKLPLTFEGIRVHRVAPNETFQLKSWQGQGERYTLSVHDGVLKSSSAAHNPY